MVGVVDWYSKSRCRVLEEIGRSGVAGQHRQVWIGLEAAIS